MYDNIITLTDSYKVSHYKQYPPGTEHVYSYLEARGGEYDKTVFFGLQYIIKKYLTKPITLNMLDEARLLWTTHFGQDMLNYDGWKYIIDNYNGYLPIQINAVKEGSVIDTGNVLMTIENTDKNVPWLTNWLETLLMQVWYPTTVATQSYHMKKQLKYYLELSGNPALIDFKLHDFGFRGSTSVESAGIGGAAHLVNFMGTDTSPALLMAMKYYGADMPGFSIPAAEHSTITSWGRDKEKEAYANMLEQYPTGMVAVVSDSYDLYNAVTNIWGDALKEQILLRDGVLIIRPDSGEPNTVLPTVFNLAKQKFGGALNEKGYWTFPDKIRFIQGDGIDRMSLSYLLRSLTEKKWSIDNIAFGSGGGLLQKVNRDTCKFAIKCSSITINGEERVVFKDPKTDVGKRSKKGRFALVKGVDDKFITISETNGFIGLLEPVYYNGKLLREQKFHEIKAITAAGVE